MKGKGNDGTGNNEERDGWQTSQELFNKLNEQYDFGFDCCASFENHKCDNWTSDFEEVEYKQIHETCWMNPPFSKAKEMFQHFFKVIKSGVAIYRCDNMETKIWQEDILKLADWIFIPKGRISYEGKVGKGSRFPSALIGYNVPPPKLDMEGTILKVWK